MDGMSLLESRFLPDVDSNVSKSEASGDAGELCTLADSSTQTMWERPLSFWVEESQAEWTFPMALAEM